MSNQNNMSVGSTVRVRYGRNAGETARVTKISWHSNQFGSYARVHLRLNGGESDERSIDDLEPSGDADAYVKAAAREDERAS